MTAYDASIRITGRPLLDKVGVGRACEQTVRGLTTLETRLSTFKATELPTWITGDIFVSSEALVTLNAWEPFDFTVGILFELQNSDIDDEHPEWRTHWIAGVAALRIIGHVLHKIDGLRSPRHKELIDAAWSRWSSDKDANWIFFDFIEKERNNILKEFSFGAKLPGISDERLLAYGTTDHDAAQLFREAVYWWRAQLRDLERSLA